LITVPIFNGAGIHLPCILRSTLDDQIIHRNIDNKYSTRQILAPETFIA
jgi:hypothetical protein